MCGLEWISGLATKFSLVVYVFIDLTNVYSCILVAGRPAGTLGFVTQLLTCTYYYIMLPYYNALAQGWCFALVLCNVYVFASFGHGPFHNWACT